MLQNILYAIAILGIWWISRERINTWLPIIRFLVNLLGVGLPICLVFEPFIDKYLKNYQSRTSEKANSQFVKELIGRHFGNQTQTIHQNPFNEEATSVDQYPTLLNSKQIEQLNTMRSQIAVSDAIQFPKIRLSGHDMPNLVPGAGLFSAKIERNGTIQNLVVMLSSMVAVSEFEKLCYSFSSMPKDFWAEGYLLPSRAGLCYSVLLVTSFRFCGKKLNF